MKVFHSNGGGDEQYTPKEGVELLLPYIQQHKDKIIWLPFDNKESQFVNVLSENGFKVVYSHIETGQDFLFYEPDKWDIIISNPPYKNKRIYIERCIKFNKPFALLLPINTLSDSVLNVLFYKRNIQLLIPEKRMRFYNAKTGKTGNQPTFKAIS